MRPNPRHRPAPPGARAGVSMIEMLVVIILIGILAGIAASRLDWVRYRADSVARGVLADLSAAQRTAVSLQTDVRITTLSNDRLRIHEDANNNGAVDGSERVTFTVLENGFRFGKGSMAGTPAPADATDLSTVTLVFRRDGTASRGGTFYLSSPVADTTCRYCRAVAIARSTGRAVGYSNASGAWVRAN
ncbi:MAG TPA: GspH/FimT family protein [Gemmatimonadales bacterium]|nr:GspH/FimT family protein [Gemmatimonadales bacterium]HRX20051.1 GspH/FimT family protein [Gemmatimonadales bacterium]